MKLLHICVLWIVSIFLIQPPDLQAEQTLARMCFWIPPERMTEFETAFEDKVVPFLKTQGLEVSSTPGRPTVSNVFARLFEVKTPADVLKIRNILDENPDWTALLKDLRTTFDNTDSARPRVTMPQDLSTMFGKGDFGGAFQPHSIFMSPQFPAKRKSQGQERFSRQIQKKESGEDLIQQMDQQAQRCSKSLRIIMATSGLPLGAVV